MERFTIVQGPAAPLLLPNIDTDIIIPIQRLVGAGRHGLGPYAFERLRYLADGRENPDFVLNRPPFRHSPILLTGPNFGCGSSREGAVWALKDYGFRCLIAPSFGDIFFANCFQNGLLPLLLPETEIRRIAAETEAQTPIRPTTVDLLQQVLTTPAGRTLPFTIDPRRREALLEGLDAIALTLRLQDRIRAWQEADRRARPWVWEA